MDGAWALYEAWVKIQTGAADTALVYGYGKSSPGVLRDVLSRQLDPYYQGPLWPDSLALAALQGRACSTPGSDGGGDGRRRRPQPAGGRRQPVAGPAGSDDPAVLLKAGRRAAPGGTTARRSPTAPPPWCSPRDVEPRAERQPGVDQGIDHRIEAHALGVCATSRHRRRRPPGG